MPEQFLEYHVYKLRTISQKIFCNWRNVQIRHCKKVPCPLSKISLHYQSAIDQRLTVIHQMFSWTSAGPSKFPIHKMSGSQGHLTVWRVPKVPSVLDKNSFTKNFFKMNKVSNQALQKISLYLHYQTVIGQRITILNQLFSWSSVGTSKCAIHKMIGSQGHLKIRGVPKVPCVLVKNFFTENFFQMKKFSN